MKNHSKINTVDFPFFTDQQKISFTGSYARLLHTICNIEPNDNMGTDILKAFEKDPILNGIIRICFASRSGLSQRLQVICSANLDPHLKSLLTYGSWCFVNKDSTLFQIKSGSVRTYSNANTILKSYHKLNLAPQRSIDIIAKSGVKSGLAKPLWIDGIQRGFLFFNSKVSNFFSGLQNEDIVLFEIILQKMTHLLIKRRTWDPDFEHFLSDLSDLWNTEFFSLEKSRVDLNRIFKNFLYLNHLNFSNFQFDRDFLHTPILLLYPLYRILETQGNSINQCSIQLIYDENNNQMGVFHIKVFDIFKITTSLLAELNYRMSFYDVSLTLKDNKIELKLPIEFRQGKAYSKEIFSIAN